MLWYCCCFLFSSLSTTMVRAMTTTKQPMTANAYVCNVYTMLAVVAAAAYICQLCWPFNSSLHFILYRVLLWQLDRGGSKGGYNSCISAILQKVNIKFRHCLLATSGPALNLLIHFLVGTFSIFGLCTCFISVFLHSFTLFFHFLPPLTLQFIPIPLFHS